jgi:hypothetical protein
MDVVCLGKYWSDSERSPLGREELENAMKRQRFTAEQIIAKLREVDVPVSRGSTADAMQETPMPNNQSAFARDRSGLNVHRDESAGVVSDIL